MKKQFEDEILLELEQKELLVSLVEASRNVPRHERKKFFAVQYMGRLNVVHSGLPNNQIPAYIGDIEALSKEDLISVNYDSKNTPNFDVTPKGFKYYEYLKEQDGESSKRIVSTMKSYLKGDAFKEKYASAYQKWARAESMLWTSDSEKQLTTIGHLCREAMQEFVTALVNYYKLSDAEKDISKTTRRIMAVLKYHADKLGETEKPFIEALFHYWRTVSDIVQRQEHGGQKEGEPLVWEDGRRVVFQTAIVMFEIDISLSR